MGRKPRELVEPKRFETTNLCLGAALLAEVPGCSLAQISPTPSVDGKRLLTLTYPLPQEAEVRRVVEAFLQRHLLINLYVYNRSLNLLRDRLRQGEKAPCRSATPS